MNRVKLAGLVLVAIMLLCCNTLSAQSKREQAKQSIEQLREVVKRAEKKKINTLKERTAIRTAEIFMDYADWDEANKETVAGYHKVTGAFRTKSNEYAEMLPDYQREEIIKMMNRSIEELTAVLDRKEHRLETPEVDWSRVSVEGDAIKYKGLPVFLADWTWKPRSKRFTEYHGAQSLYMITPMQVGTTGLFPKVSDEIKAKTETGAGFIFLSHAGMPAWAKKKDATISDGAGVKYVMYDIHNPLNREIYSTLIKGTVPLIADKKYSELGYMLCNEPHWNLVEGHWASTELSDLAIEDLRSWLRDKHGDIATLNRRWGSSFANFESAELPRTIKASQRGGAIYNDMCRFNMDRVNDWFTFLNKEVLKYDPKANTHIKMMPNLWAQDRRDHGLDMEYLTRLTTMIGNDAASGRAWLSGDRRHWEDHYDFNWEELAMGYDFYKSISPEKAMFNTEGHFLSTGRYRELEQSAEYARCNYWLATLHGQTATQTWFWARDEKGAYSRSGKVSTGYAASNNFQPQVVNEVHATIADLNSVSDLVMQFQRQRKPLRIFYTEATAINKDDYMERDIFKIYEDLYFEGMPVGFATKGIIENNDNSQWDAVVVYNTPYVYSEDLDALQRYLNGGGVVIVDSMSLQSNEYGEPIGKKLSQSKGKLIEVESIEKMLSSALEVAADKGVRPAIYVEESNALGQDAVSWRVLPTKESGKYILNLANIGKGEAKLTLSSLEGKKVASLRNVLNGKSYDPSTLTLKLNEVLLLEVELSK